MHGANTKIERLRNVCRLAGWSYTPDHNWFQYNVMYVHMP